jgi:hypothetical protein
VTLLEDHRSEPKAAVLLSLLLMLASAASAATAVPCVTGSSVAQWQCWEQQITSSIDFYNNGTGNPYKDLVLRVTFTQSGTGAIFTQDAFWLADTVNPRNFKVRAALPAGTWTWQITGCTGVTGGHNCSTGVTWTPAPLPINVISSTSGPQLYARGFPTQFHWCAYEVPNCGFNPITYGDLVTPFYWAGDTAWGAPGLEASGQASHWGAYATDRSSKGFNVALIAPSATYQMWPWSTGTMPFVPPSCSGTTAPTPNDCSRPNPAYWNNFDTLISTANQNGIVPLIAGLIDPLDTASSGHYPYQPNAVTFSRYLAARMSGYAVMYSPGFDDQTTALTWSDATHPAIQLQQVMSAVGAAVKQAAPNYLITNHLGGKLTCSDYQYFRYSGWMSFFMFQSSHGGGLPTKSPDPTDVCPMAVDTSETPVQGALRRSWQMPWTLTSNRAVPPLPGTDAYNPVLPSYNGEGPYDNICLQTPGCTCPANNPPMWCHNYDSTNTSNFGASYVDIRYHNRQAAYESLFSGAYGYTYGAQEIAHWYFPSTYPITFNSALSGPAVGDIRSVFQNFNTLAGSTPQRDWITNNGPDTADNGNLKMALASDGTSIVLAYLPAGSASTINISTTNAPGLACTGWTYKWSHAQDNLPDQNPILCNGTNPIQITRPDLITGSSSCSAPYNQACDWVLQIQRTQGASVTSQAASSGQGLDVWADLSPQDGTSALYASLTGRGIGSGETPILISPSGLAFQQSPRVTRIPSGYLVAWQADGLDGSMLGAFAQLLDRSGQPVGNRIQVNTTTEKDQRDPAVDSDPSGNTVIVWSSYEQDGDMGGIYGRLFDSNGSPLTGEFQVNSETVGHQEMPQVAYLPGGNFAVAWQTHPIGNIPGALSFRVFSRGGAGLTNEIRFPGRVGIISRVVDLAATPTAGLRLRWGLEGLDGSHLGFFSQEFGATGNAVSAATPLP